MFLKQEKPLKNTMKGHKFFFVDTNIFLRLIARDDEKQYQECLQVMNKVREEKFQAFTSPLVLAEVQWTLGKFYQLKKDEIIRAMQAILSLRNLKIIEDADFQTAVTLYTSHSIKFVDCLIASHFSILQGTLQILSYDKEFDKIKGVERVEPKKILS